MTLAEMITLYRAQAQDEKEPVFCSDELLTVYANQAVREACRRGRLLRDAVSPMCTIQFAAGQRSVELDKRILHVIDADVDYCDVRLFSAAQMDEYTPGWKRTTNMDRPQVLVSGVTTNALHLYPPPAAAGEIHLHVLRLPLEPMASPADEPEIREEAHEALVEWMLYRAYSRQDIELYDEQKARGALASFEAEFGRKASLRNEQWVRDGADLDVPPLA